MKQIKVTLSAEAFQELRGRALVEGRSIAGMAQKLLLEGLRGKEKDR